MATRTCGIAFGNLVKEMEAEPTSPLPRWEDFRRKLKAAAVATRLTKDKKTNTNKYANAAAAATWQCTPMVSDLVFVAPPKK